MKKVTRYSSVKELKAASPKCIKKDTESTKENAILIDFVSLLRKNAVPKTQVLTDVK